MLHVERKGKQAPTAGNSMPLCLLKSLKVGTYLQFLTSQLTILALTSCFLATPFHQAQVKVC